MCSPRRNLRRAKDSRGQVQILWSRWENNLKRKRVAFKATDECLNIQHKNDTEGSKSSNSDLEEIAILLKSFDRILRKERKGHKGGFSSFSRSESLSQDCYNCGKSGHYAKDCKSKSKLVDKSDKDRFWRSTSDNAKNKRKAFISKYESGTKEE